MSHKTHIRFESNDMSECAQDAVVICEEHGRIDKAMTQVDAEQIEKRHQRGVA